MTCYEKIKQMNIDDMAEVISLLIISVNQKVAEQLYEILNLKQPEVTEDTIKEVIKLVKEWLESEE